MWWVDVGINPPPTMTFAWATGDPSTADETRRSRSLHVSERPSSWPWLQTGSAGSDFGGAALAHSMETPHDDRDQRRPRQAAACYRGQALAVGGERVCHRRGQRPPTRRRAGAMRGRQDRRLPGKAARPRSPARTTAALHESGWIGRRPLTDGRETDRCQAGSAHDSRLASRTHSRSRPLSYSRAVPPCIRRIFKASWSTGFTQ